MTCSPRKKKCTLPWWFQIIAWLLVVACIGVSVFFLWAYGITFGNDKTTKWVTSLVTSFFSSILLVQPIKVFLMAIFLSVVCKAEPDDDDADEDEEDPSLRYDEQWIHETDGNRWKDKKLGYRPMNRAALEAAREKRMREVKMWDVMKEIASYVLYLWVLLVQDTDKFWQWVHGVVMDEVRAQNWYNGDAPWGLRGFMNDRVNRILGYPIMRQIRVVNDSCTLPWQARNFTHCAGLSNVIHEERRDFCVFWKLRSEVADPITNCSWDEFKFNTAEDLQGLPIVGMLDVYSGGGYVIRLKGRESEIRDRLQQLQHLEWFDAHTRAVMLEIYTYNAQVNLFGVLRVMAEMLPGGGLKPSWRFDGIRLLQYHTGFGLFVLVCEILYVIFALYFTYRAFRACCKSTRAYLRSYWSYAEMGTVLVAWTAVGLYLYRVFLTKDVLQRVQDTYGNEYIRLQYVALVDEILGYLIAALTFVGTIMFLKLLRFNKRIGVLSSTMKQCWDDLIGYAIVFYGVFIAFCLMFYLFFFRELEEWRNFVTAFETCSSMMLGKFQFDSMKNTNVVAAIFFFFFAIIMSIIMLNLLLTIIIRAFEAVKRDVAKQSNEYEILDFIWGRFRTFIGMPLHGGSAVAPEGRGGAGGAEMAKEDPGAAQFPIKVDRMLEYINRIYFDGSLDLDSKEGLKKKSRNISGRNTGHIRE
ncbi:unnamed protein product [Darwinula stevensoni]|uniref:Uncharacterized protein n=1 Tax=Darwinula stevensoni TaxID=69355 RepID=A0A7R9AI20_9CRUS|nr:unnamed protein product [Darwinula stevensoni]CAG0905453.1 unnamed protein product [Darwinula stevensoni]